ncbi:hypothetical protein ACVCL0_09220 [Rhodanobacter sp. UC4450_H17]
MTGLATTVLSGDAAFLVATQAELLTNHNGCDVYKLKTPDLRVGVYESATRRLVIFDAAALVALALSEVTDVPQTGFRPISLDEGEARIEYLHPVAAADPPSRL